jgi:hypothetical protein
MRGSLHFEDDVSRFLPFALLLFITFFPAFVEFLFLKPWVFTRFLLDG